METINKETLDELYQVKLLTPHEISEILNLPLETIFYWLKEYKIEEAPKTRKYEHIKRHPLIQEQRELLVGCILGNGKLDAHGKDGSKVFRVIIEHPKNEKNILIWKKTILGNLVNIIFPTKDDKLRFNTANHHELVFIYKMMIDNNKKSIIPNISKYFSYISLLAWISDSGQYKDNCFHINSWRYSEKEHEVIINIIREKIEIEGKIEKYIKNNKEYCKLYFDILDSEKIVLLANNLFLNELTQSIMLRA